MRIYMLAFFLFMSSCKKSGSEKDLTTGAKLGAADAQAMRDVNYQERNCYCSFLLDDAERRPFTEQNSLTSGKSRICEFNTGTDGREDHRMDTLSVQSFSGAQLQQFDEQVALLTKDFSENLARYSQSVRKGSDNDVKIELRIGKMANQTYEKRAVAYDEYSGRMFIVTERSLETNPSTEISSVFDDTGLRYIDELLLNYQGACEAVTDL